MSKPVIPPVDGTLSTLVEFLDFNARHNAQQPFFTFPSDDDPSRLTSLTFADVTRASHIIAHALRPGRHGKDGETVGILLHTDTVLYVAVLLGSLRAGLVPYAISPRNTPHAVSRLLDATSCTQVVCNDLVDTLVADVRADQEAKGRPLLVLKMPALSVAFPTLNGPGEIAPIEPYPPPQTHLDMQSTVLYLHSSGSTGLPKSIPYTRVFLTRWFNVNLISGARLRGLRYGAMGLPTFHAMGISQHLFFPLTSGQDVVVFAPQHPAPPTVPHPQNIYELGMLSGCDAISLVPSIVEAWSRDDEIVQFMRTLRLVTFGGGPLTQSIGDKLVAAGVPLRSVYGGTEFSSPCKVWPEPITAEPLKPSAEWAWLEWSARTKTRMVPQGDGTYELVLMDNGVWPLAVYNVSGEKTYATADLFAPHPTKEGLWKVVGRRDDVIMLSTGEKIVPIPQEGHIGTSPLVMGCLMFGRGREQAGLLVEPSLAHALDPQDEAALIQFRNKLWPVVEEANADAPAFAKIFKEMIIMTDPRKPLPRAAKGTTQRKAAIALYEPEIDKLYETVNESTNPQGVSLPNSWDEAELVRWLSVQAASVNNDHDHALDADLFQQGFDSLSATFFRNRIIGALRTSCEPHLTQAAQRISPNLVFEHPTIPALAALLSRIVNILFGDGAHVPASVRATDIEALIHKYTADIPKARTPASASTDRKSVVLLTGSTGNIGSHILAYLLADDRIARVYTLNRASAISPIDRLQEAFAERALPADLLGDPKLRALAGDVTQHTFGLEPALYQELLANITHIIHNGWTVNFNLPLQSYEDQVAGVRQLVDVCATADHPIKLLVTSSIGAAGLWDASQGPVPERPLPDPAVAISNGYSASKYVVEQILAKVAEGGLGATAVRMGQACGPKATGAWGTTEWMPIMVKSSVALGCLPAMSGSVSWVPLDAISRTYVDWTVSGEALPLLVNVVHPRPTSWDVILRGISSELGDLPLVPPDVWISKLEVRSDSASGEDLAKIPALKILPFFRRLTTARLNGEDGVNGLHFATDALQLSSPTMCELQPLPEEHARMWVRYWKSKNYL